MGLPHSYIESTKVMSGRDFERLSVFIMSHCGIKMPPSKKTLLESRLQKRLRLHGMASFREYCDLVLDGTDSSDELVHMIDAVTTNKTDFFREPVHFSFLTDTALPEYMEEPGVRSGRRFMVWSAGCSSGEEPYTLAIVLSEFAAKNPGFQFSMLATDISTRVLDKARLGIYDEDQITMIPLHQKQKYFLRSKDRKKEQVRVVPQLRSIINFQRLNLMEDQFAVPHESLDALFCRNVMIYFDRQTQYRLLSKFCRHIRTGKYLYLGHSETIQGLDLPLVRIASTIYRKVP